MKKNKWWREIGGWGISIVLGFVLSMIIGIFIIQPYKVDGHSMEPTLSDKQRIYAWKFAHVLEKAPKFGDIVIIDSRVERDRTFLDDVKEHPIITWMSGKDHDVFYVKRVIGLPGDTIEVKDGQVYRNGEQLQETYIKEAMDTGAAPQIWEIPDQHVFVMGDNRNNSNDSRSIGPVPLDHVMGIDSF
ncbi:signal peptidase I [Paenibacillus senegalimassiliensis]|uniref:signal peptidase I n=1 Tax=Paenibacillus senegalimassiliensis TaxID=1737426 RepID=UPI00073ED019|nr:signal peptidase I [Paenibacillus senegalimassiliensis]